MPTHRLQSLIAIAAVIVLAMPAIAHAGDSPIFVVRDWGVGEIDGKIMFYVGKGAPVITSIPAPPSGPRWDIIYNAFPCIVVAVLGFWPYRRWPSQTLRRSKVRARFSWARRWAHPANTRSRTD